MIKLFQWQQTVARSNMEAINPSQLTSKGMGGTRDHGWSIWEDTLWESIKNLPLLEPS